MHPRETKEILQPAETELADNVVQFPVVGPLRPKPRSKPPELPVQSPQPVILPPPITRDHVLPGRMKRSGQPLQMWTSPYRKVPPRPTKIEIARSYIEFATGRIKSATSYALQELVKLYQHGKHLAAFRAVRIRRS